MERVDQRQRGASKCLRWALEAAAAGTYAEVPKLLDQARALVNDGELSGVAELYREFFELPPARELPPPDLPLTWLGRAAGEQLDARARRALRERGLDPERPGYTLFETVVEIGERGHLLRHRHGLVLSTV